MSARLFLIQSYAALDMKMIAIINYLIHTHYVILFMVLYFFLNIFTNAKSNFKQEK